MKHKGRLTFINQETGKLDSCEIDLPIETYITVLAWGLDMIRALHERPHVVRWLIRLLMGRYAYRELIGLRDSIEKAGYTTTYNYGIEGCEYHQDKVGDL